MKKVLIVAVVAALVWYVFLRTPPAQSITQATAIDQGAGTIQFDDTTYEATWADATKYSGDLRYMGRAYSEYAPFITHDAVVTTGEFSDPEIVTIGPMRKGNTWWKAPRQPSGTLVVLHFIPADLGVLDRLNGLGEGDSATFTGHVEADGHITASDGGFLKLMHDNHKIMLVTAVE